MRKSTKVMAALGVVAGLGVALAPLATFADGNIGVDNLTVNVNSDCDIDTTGGGAAFAGNYVGQGQPGDLVEISRNTSNAGTYSVSFACSENSKIQIKAYSAGLTTSDNGGDTIAATAIYGDITTTNGLTAVAGYTSSAYSLALATTPGVVVANGTAPAAASGKMTITVNGYKAQLKNDQKPGTYTGTVTYTFANVQ